MENHRRLERTPVDLVFGEGWGCLWATSHTFLYRSILFPTLLSETFKLYIRNSKLWIKSELRVQLVLNHYLKLKFSCCYKIGTKWTEKVILADKQPFTT